MQILGESPEHEGHVVALTEDDLLRLVRTLATDRHIERAARISLAGAQEKLSLYRMSDGRWSVPLGGHPSSHILKPANPRYPGIVRNEHLCMRIAREAELPAANTWIETIGEHDVLVVERYDRTTTPTGRIQRIHQEDMTQALGRTAKYQAEPGGPSIHDLLSVQGICREDVLRQMMYHWLIGNCDGHGKNFSILEPGTSRARLAPLYDVLCTEHWPSLDRTLAISLGGAKTLNTVDRAAVEALGRRIGLQPGQALDMLRELAERVRAALKTLDESALETRVIALESIKRRLDQVCDWSRARC